MKRFSKRGYIHRLDVARKHIKLNFSLKHVCRHFVEWFRQGFIRISVTTVKIIRSFAYRDAIRNLPSIGWSIQLLENHEFEVKRLQNGLRIMHSLIAIPRRVPRNLDFNTIELDNKYSALNKNSCRTFLEKIVTSKDLVLSW